MARAQDRRFASMAAYGLVERIAMRSAISGSQMRVSQGGVLYLAHQ